MPALFLIPTPLGAADTPCLLPHEQAHIVHLTDFVVEAEKTARAHLKHMGVRTPIRELNLGTLNEHTPKSEVAALLQPLREGRDLGLVSEAGCPAVADPGADLVALAHAEGFEVRPLVGASSILLALMASGANGQSFAFKGYLPADKDGRAGCLRRCRTRCGCPKACRAACGRAIGGFRGRRRLLQHCVRQIGGCSGGPAAV